MIEPTDSMTMLVSSTSHLATHVDIRTDYEDGPMTVAQDYSSIPDGPNLMKTMKVSVPQKEIVVNVDSYASLGKARRANRKEESSGSIRQKNA